MRLRRDEAMKSCDRCGASNPETALFCRDCGKPLRADARQKSAEMAAAEAARQTRLEKNRLRRGHLLLCGMYALYAALTALLLTQRQIEGAFVFILVALLFPGMGYLSLYKADFLFRLQHMFTINNLDAVEPSDYYYLSSRIGGIVIWCLGIVLLLGPFFSW